MQDVFNMHDLVNKSFCIKHLGEMLHSAKNLQFFVVLVINLNIKYFDFS